MIAPETLALGFLLEAAWHQWKRFRRWLFRRHLHRMPYQFFKLGEPSTVISDNRDIAQAPRGEIRWIKHPDEDG